MNSNKIISGFVIFISLLILVSCSQTESIKKQDSDKDESEELAELIEQDLQIGDRKIYSWVNLMPNSETRFHLTGEVQVIDNAYIDLSYLKLSQIKVMQNNNLVYLINPVVQVDDSKSSHNSLYLKFSTVRGLLLNAGLNTDKPVTLELIFEQGSDQFAYTFENVSIEEAH